MKLTQEEVDELKKVAHGAFFMQTIKGKHFADDDVQEAYHAYTRFIDNVDSDSLKELASRAKVCESKRRENFEHLSKYLSKLRP